MGSLLDEILAGVYKDQPGHIRDDLRALANDRLIEEDVRRRRAQQVLAGVCLNDILLAERQTRRNNGTSPTVDAAVDPHCYLINWPEFWAQNHTDEEWIAWPVIPAHRQTAIYAPAKAGKSLLILDIVAAVATGRPILGQANIVEPRHCLYLDYEMTQADLRERLEDMGYGPDDDLSHLHYASLPSLPALNMPEGAKAVLELAQSVHAELVVVDTLARAVEGDENKADTVNDFYRWTGLALKAAGITLVRIDHAGKDLSKGQRGSSAKNGDVDLVWELTRADEGLWLKRTHSRIGWIKEKVAVAIGLDPLVHTVAADLFDAGAKECADLIDTLGLPLDISKRAAMKALREAGTGKGSDVVNSALRYRRENLRTTLRTTSGDTARTTVRTTTPEINGDQVRYHFQDHLGPSNQSKGLCVPTVGRTTTPDPAEEF